MSAPSDDNVPVVDSAADMSSFVSFPALSYTPDESHEEPHAVASDDGTFGEMKWLLGAEEPHVRAIAAQVLLGLAADEENRRRICTSGCLPALNARMFDRVCGTTVQRVLVKLSMDRPVAEAMLALRGEDDDDDEIQGLMDHLESGIHRGQISYEAAALLANLAQLEMCGTARVCALVAHAMRMPIKPIGAMDNEAMEDELPSITDRHFQIYEVLCMAASNAVQRNGSCDKLELLWEALSLLDSKHRQLQQSVRWNGAVLALLWNATLNGMSLAPTSVALLQAITQRPNARLPLLKLQDKRASLTAPQTALVPNELLEILDSVQR